MQLSLLLGNVYDDDDDVDVDDDSSGEEKIEVDNKPEKTDTSSQVP